MFLYDVYGYECHCILVHEKEFTKEEFKTMCDEAPELQEDPNYFYTTDELIIKHLTEKYGFKKAKISACYFTGF
ncbi:MAG: hypothetical protein E6377_04330 [Clostridium sp.]|nr:hypothetical protein [Clostridium sp.]MDU1095116.1 hypothetical protein [Clostridioides difficile]MDU3675124.1 hypothetical protein [Clostridium sp.]MDU6934721.1 hypothetical protein [Clostridium sp.]